MKLLLDENLSRRLVPFLQEAYSGTTQAALIGLEQASDRTLWRYAKDNDYVIVTQDADFQELSLLLGHPLSLCNRLAAVLMGCGCASRKRETGR